MDILILLKGVTIGFGLAIPIGPLGVLSVRRTLSDGLSFGLIIGLGAATVDGLYGGVAAFGLTYISDFVVSQRLVLRVLGGGILLVLGIRTFFAKKKETTLQFGEKGIVAVYLSSILLAMTNPMPIFAFGAVFAAFGLGHTLLMASAGMLVLGVFAGSFCWFLTLGYAAKFFRRKLTGGGFKWVNRVAGAMIVSSGIIVFVSLI